MENKEIGFCRGLFFGKIKEELIIPFPQISKDEEDTINMFLDSLKKFASEKIDPVKIDKEEKIPDEVIKGMEDLGLFGMTVPVEYGGAGFSTYQYGRVMAELTKYCTGTAVFLGAHLSIGIKGIILFGTSEQKEKYLKKITEGLAEAEGGEYLACFALTEPDAGCDVSNMKTKAILNEDATYYIINGSKQWITNSNIANLITLFAKTEIEEGGKKEEKITAFIVTKDMEGKIVVSKEDKKMGIRGSPTCSFIIENLKVPAENILGGKGQGFKVAMNVLNYGRLGLAMGCVGAANKMLELSKEHAKTRVQFGVPISNFEMIKEKFADISSLIFVMESMTELTCKNADRGIDFAIESAICKVFCTESLWKIINHAIQINGGNGYMREYPYERFLRDARINMIFEGTNEILRVFIALEGIKLPAREFTDFLKALKNPFVKFNFLIKFLSSKIKQKLQATPKLNNVDATLDEISIRLGKYVKRFSLGVDKIIIKYGKKIIEKEFLQERISEIVINLYAVFSTVAKINDLIKTKGKDNVSYEIDILKFFSNQAFKNIESNLSGLFKNDDKLKSRISDETIKS